MTTKSTLCGHSPAPSEVQYDRLPAIHSGRVLLTGVLDRIEAVAQWFSEKSLSGIMCRCEKLIPKALPLGSLGLLPNDEVETGATRTVNPRACNPLRSENRLTQEQTSQRFNKAIDIHF